MSGAGTLGEGEVLGVTGERARLGMLVFLSSEAMFFAGLIAGYIVLRLGSGFWRAPGEPPLPVVLTSVNTLFLVASSVTYHRAERAASGGGRGLGYLVLTLGLGSLFLVIQGREWLHLLHEGLWFNTAGIYGSSFFLLTGFHGLHVALGVVLIAFVSVGAFRGGRSERAETRMRCVGLYWHFVDIVWVILFTIVYVV